MERFDALDAYQNSKSHLSHICDNRPQYNCTCIHMSRIHDTCPLCVKTHEIYKSHINYSIAYPKPQNKRVLLGYCSHFVSFKPGKNQIHGVLADTSDGYSWEQ